MGKVAGSLGYQYLTLSPQMEHMYLSAPFILPWRTLSMTQCHPKGAVGMHAPGLFSSVWTEISPGIRQKRIQLPREHPRDMLLPRVCAAARAVVQPA